MKPRQSYERATEPVSFVVGRGRRKRTVTVPGAVVEVVTAVEVDCGDCGCPSVRGRVLVTADPVCPGTCPCHVSWRLGAGLVAS